MSVQQVEWNANQADKQIGHKVFKSGQSKICGRQSLKKLKCLKQTIPLENFSGPLLNTLSQI